jgi:dihydrofolate reductase
MRKVVAAINMTVDGFFDHTTLIADEEIHQHYNDLLRNSGTLIYGRITYQLMETSWPAIVKSPTGNEPIDEFAVLIDAIPKVVFSRTLKKLEWATAKFAKLDLREEVLKLRQETGRDILVGSRSLIVTLMNLNLIDEFQLCVQPIIATKGLLLLENIQDRIGLKLLKTKTLASSGSIVLYYEPTKK